jgi:hypothetical protein
LQVIGKAGKIKAKTFWVGPPPFPRAVTPTYKRLSAPRARAPSCHRQIIGANVNMSFGFSVGDFVTLGQLAWNVYKSCKDAPQSFNNISQEVLSLSAVLREAEESFSGQTLTMATQEGLRTVRDGCHGVLEDLQSLLDRYESLGTQTKRTWDRVGWGSNDITELRSRLTSNIGLLTALIRLVYAYIILK